MKFEVHSVRKTDIYNSSSTPPTVETKSNGGNNLCQKQMAQVDTVQLHLSSKSFIGKSNCNGQSVGEWNESQVLDWLASMSFVDLKERFQSNRITGSDLTAMTDSKLLEMGVEDKYQRKMMMTCLDELCDRQGTEEDSEGSSTESSDECTSDSSEHDLHEQTFSVPVKCHKCGKYIISGPNRQGYQCAVCGLCLHTECIKGKIQPCNSEKLEARKKSHQQTHCNALSIGSDLCKDVLKSKLRGVPDVIYICTQETERQLQQNPELNVIDAYKKQKSDEEIMALKGAFDKSGDKFAVPVGDVELFALCGVVKKYLRELTNPLIPTEWYEDFMSAAKLTEEAQGVATVGALVNELPKYHSSTIHFLFQHFCKVARLRMAKHEDIKLGLAQVFCTIMLRPDWSDITSLVHNTQHHLVVVRRLITFYDNNNTECNMTGSITPQIAQTAQAAPESAHDHNAVAYGKSENLFSHSNPYEERLLPLDQYPWYWGEVSREDVQEATSDMEEGSFLVRNATSHATHGDYTLVLRKGGGNLLVKIYHRAGLYGFCADSCSFDSVPSLVSHYQHHSLAEYNACLNLKLRRGIAKPGLYESYRSSDPQYLLKQLTRNHTELRSLTKECDSLMDKQTRMSHDMQLLHQAQESFKELSKIFEEQIDQYTHQKSRPEIGTQESNEVQKNADVLRARLQSININKDRLGHTIQQKTGDNYSLTEDINSIKPTLRSLSRKQDHIVNALLIQGITRHELEHVLRGDSHSHAAHSSSRLDPLAETSHFTHNDIPHTLKSSWYVKCTRAEATERLQHCKDGTFLVRPGSQDNPFSLSIAINGIVGHCKVLEKDGLYGFAAPYLLYDSLVDLVQHYKDHSLAHHNPQLNTKLLYPINAS